MTITLEYADETEFVTKLTAILALKGYAVTPKAPEMITVREMATKLKRNLSALSRSLHRDGCPPFESVRGKRRILRLAPNAELMAYLGHKE